VRDPSGRVIGASVIPRRAVQDAMSHCGSTTKAVMMDMEDAVYDNKHGERYEVNGYTLTRETLAAATRVTDEMVERTARVLHEESENPIKGDARIQWEDSEPYWQDKMRRMARAALEVPRD